MPTYSYRCRDCKHEFERILKVSEMKLPESEQCPECKRMSVEKFFGDINHAFMAPEQCGRVKPNEDWRGFLNKMKKNNPGSDFTTW